MIARCGAIARIGYVRRVPRFVATTVATTPALHARRVRCDGRDAPRSADEQVPVHRAWIVLRGRFRFRSSGVDAVIDPTSALLVPADDVFAVRHPDTAGDVTLSVSGAVVDAAIGARTARRPIDAGRFLRLARAGDALAVEEALGDALAGPTERAPDRRLVARAVDLLHARFDAPLSLAALAGATGASVFHLCRSFRRATGTTIHAYLLELRLRHALALVVEGERSLAAIACDTGFASQSHLTNRFRARFGAPPAAWARTCKIGQRGAG